MFKQYLRLTKPGVMFGNLITTVAGFLFASQGDIRWLLFFATIVGTSLVISSACVINNVLDQDIDLLMERTKSRPLIIGEADPKIATVFGIVLGIFGLITLIAFTNWWVVGVGVFGFITYVWLYGAFSKRRSIHGTVVGALSGAAPILAGYVAVRPGLDSAAVLLFIALFFWQMPEFYSIAIYRRKEYKKAGVPVITVQKSIPYTVKQIFLYCLAFVISSMALFIYSHVGYVYLFVMVVVNIYWILLAYDGFSRQNHDLWARHMFRHSLVVLLAYNLLLALNPWIP